MYECEPLVAGSKCPFLSEPPLLTLKSFTDVCSLVFGGLDVATIVVPSAGRANERTGGWTPGGTRVLYPSGSVDPWRWGRLSCSFTSFSFSRNASFSGFRRSITTSVNHGKTSLG